MIKLVNITQKFPPNTKNTLENAEFSLKKGEIHALLGENGAGKSTLMHILAGYLCPLSGEIYVNDKKCRFNSPKDALNHGIGMVRQHPSIIPSLSVWENCLIGAESFFIQKQKREIRDLSSKWGFQLPLDRPAASLSVSGRQTVAVLNLLLRGSHAFIFDEVTAVLTQTETRALFALFSRLRESGFSLALISHKLDETLALADRATILRDGKTIATLDTKNADASQINALLFGNTPPPNPAVSVPYKKNPEKKIKFVVKNLKVESPDKPFLRGIDLTAHANSIIGIAGVRDSGLGTLESALAGFLPRKSGEILLNNTLLPARPSPLAFRKAGIAYLSADRAGECLAIGLPMRDNLVIHSHRKQPKRVFLLDKPFLNQWARKIMEKTGLNRSIDAIAGAFSGGQLQRLLLERELAENSELLILSEAGWGLDSQARLVLSQKLRDFAQKDKTILLFSSDIDELLMFSDQIYVLRNGVFSENFVIDNKKNLPDYKTKIAQAMT